MHLLDISPTISLVIKLKQLFRYLNRISDESFCLLAGTLRTCCTMVFCAFMLLVHIGPVSPRSFSLYQMALELTLSPVGLLLIGGLCSVIVEDFFGN